MRITSVLRAVCAVLFGFVGILSLTVSTLAIWGQVTLFDSDRVADAAAVAIDAPGVTEALSIHLTDELMTALDLTDRLDSVLPGPLETLSPVIAGNTESLVQTQLDNVLQTAGVQDVLVEVVRRAHTQFVEILESDGKAGGLDIEDRTVSVNLLPLVTLGLEKIQDVGILTNLDVPQFTPDGDPSEQIAELEARLGRDLSEDFGQLAVFKGDAVSSGSSALQTAQDTMVLARRGTVAVTALTVVTLGLSILVARRRRRVVATLGLAVVAAMVVTRLILDRVVSETPDVVTNPGARSALEAAIGYLSESLAALLIRLLVVGVVIAVIAYLTGQGRLASRLKTTLGIRRFFAKKTT